MTGNARVRRLRPLRWDEGRLGLVGLVLLALILRVIWMPILLHTDPRIVGDIVELNRQAYVIYQGQIERFLYPPLFPITLNLFQKVLFQETPLFAQMPLEGLDAQVALLTDPSIFSTLTLMKIWYLPFDIGVAFLLWKISGRAASLFWLFNPLIIYNAYIHGQFDVVPLFFVALGLYSSQRNHPNWAVFWMGIGACFKTFPFLFLLPLVLVSAETWTQRFKLLLLGTLPYIALTLPFPEHTAIMQTYPIRFFRAGFDLGFGAQVYFFFLFYAVLLWYLYEHKASTFQHLWRACFAILLVYYQFSYFDLHYWAWIVPFAAIYWAERPHKAKPFYIVILACLLILTAPTPLARFLAPISPRFFLRLPSLMEALSPYLPVSFALNVVRSLLAGTCFYLAWRLLRDIPASRTGATQAAPDPATVS